MSFGNVPFNITSMVVCAQNASGAHTGDPVRLANGQMMSIDPESEKLDPLMGYGKRVELATILLSATFSLSQGGLDLAAWKILTGLTLDESGTTPNQGQEAHKAAGGAGLPYFGLIGSLASTNSSNVLMGLCRAKLDNMPSLNAEQNNFVIPEVEGETIRNPGSGYEDVPFIIKTYETAAEITLTSDFFDTFFNIS